MNNSMPHMDGINNEIMKTGGETVIEWICALWNQVWESGDVPEDCKNVSIVCISKKGNLNECDNWTSVTLVNTEKGVLPDDPELHIGYSGGQITCRTDGI